VRMRPWVLAVIATVAVATVVAVPLALGRDSGSSTNGRPPGDVVSTPAPTSAATPGTSIHRVLPVDARGKLLRGYRVADSARGRCFSASLLAPGLFRCFRGNTILDPCWKQAGRHDVLCLTEPWSHRLLRVRVGGKLPPPAGFPARWWAVRAGGPVAGHCTAAMGAAGVVHGEPVTYLCAHGWVLLGDGPDRRTPIWSMVAARRVHGGSYRVHGPVPLSLAWKAVAAP